MRLERGLRWSIYTIVAALFATGVAWWVLDEGPSTARLYLIAAHGLAAMAFLVALGAILVGHVREGWRRRLNRASGTLALTIAGLLILTAFGLYYVCEAWHPLFTSSSASPGRSCLPLTSCSDDAHDCGRRPC